MVAYTRRSPVRPSLTPIWGGSRFPMTTSLGEAVRARLDAYARDAGDGAPEIAAARPILDEQRRLSAIPRLGEVLIERWRSRAGHHLFVYPFEGRQVHQAMASLVAFRLGKRTPGTFSLTVNDYGLELLSEQPVPPDELLDRAIIAPGDLLADLSASVNMGELARRQFRDIARVAGLVFAGYPGAPKGSRQIQLTSSLVYDVFTRYDPDNLLVVQAHREVLELQFELTRLEGALTRLAGSTPLVTDIRHPTPLAFPLVIDRLGSRLSTENLIARVERMIAQWQD
jgi:ATP-dependent Lhr-like helicase